MTEKKTIADRKLERSLESKIDAWVNGINWPSHEEVRAIADKTNVIFDDWRCGNIEFVRINKYARGFTAYMTLVGYPRNDNTKSYCPKIHVLVKGTIIFQATPDSIDKGEGWIIGKNYEISVHSPIITLNKKPDPEPKPANNNNGGKKAI